ncbi:MAG: hypothetical protein AAF658_09680 [Myxococcota bacterium]
MSDELLHRYRTGSPMTQYGAAIDAAKIADGAAEGTLESPPSVRDVMIARQILQHFTNTRPGDEPIDLEGAMQDSVRIRGKLRLVRPPEAEPVNFFQPGSDRSEYAITWREAVHATLFPPRAMLAFLRAFTGASLASPRQ